MHKTRNVDQISDFFLFFSSSNQGNTKIPPGGTRGAGLIPPTPPPPGLPLGIYTNHWQRTSTACTGIGKSINSGKCLAAYRPDEAYDIQGIFDVDVT